MNRQVSINDGETVREQYASSSQLDARIALHARFTVTEKPFYEWMMDKLPLRAGARVLDIGCGPCELWRAVLNRVPNGVRLTMADLSGGMLATGRERLLACGARVTDAPDAPGADDRPVFSFREADVTALPFADGAFDLTIANHMLYHVPDIPQALREIRRVTARGGAFVCATNGEDNMRELWAICAAFDSDIGRPGKPFTLENGADMLKATFSHVERRDYPAKLFVTDARALRDYIASMAGIGVDVDDARLDALERDFEARIASEGGVTIRKSTGIFICS